VNVVVAPHVADTLHRLAQSKPHAIVFSGLAGVGLATIAKETASQWGEIIEIMSPEAKTKSGIASISVEKIRSLYELSRTKAATSRIVIIDDADAMTESAQNAVLKLLEEPAANVHFFLTTHAPDGLLPTIRSRAQHIQIPPVDSAATARFLRSLHVEDDATKRQLLFVADGLPAEAYRLAKDPIVLQKKSKIVRQAYEFIAGTPYEKLVITQSIASDRAYALDFIDAALLLLKNHYKVAPKLLQFYWPTR